MVRSVFDAAVNFRRARPRESLASARESIVRPSIWVTGFIVLGHGFYYLLLLSGNRMLPPAGFSRFYPAWAMLNVLVTPSSVLTMLLTRHLSEANRAGGSAAIRVVLKQVA